MKLTADLLSQLSDRVEFRSSGQGEYQIQAGETRILVFSHRGAFARVGIHGKDKLEYSYLDCNLETVADLLGAIVELTRTALADRVTAAMRQGGADFY